MRQAEVLRGSPARSVHGGLAACACEARVVMGMGCAVYFEEEQGSWRLLEKLRCRLGVRYWVSGAAASGGRISEYRGTVVCGGLIREIRRVVSLDDAHLSLFNI